MIKQPKVYKLRNEHFISTSSATSGVLYKQPAAWLEAEPQEAKVKVWLLNTAIGGKCFILDHYNRKSPQLL